MLLTGSACQPKKEQPISTLTAIEEKIITARIEALRPKDVDLLKQDWKRGEITTKEFTELLDKTKYVYILYDIAKLRAEKRVRGSELASESSN